MLDLSKSIRLLVLRVLFGGEFSLEANHLVVPVYHAHCLFSRVVSVCAN